MKKYLTLALLLGSSLLGAADPIVFQPKFKWADGSYTEQGTGSFVQAPDGKVIGVTSIHFLNRTGPQLLEAAWFDIKTNKRYATSQYSLGMPGVARTKMDFSSDYLLLVMEGNIPPASFLQLDSRPKAEVGERVWFPNKDRSAQAGYKHVEGIVTEVNETYIQVKLDKPIELTGRSGTPVISQATKKVIGILTAGGIDGKYTRIYLAPIAKIHKALTESTEQFPLKEVIGQE